MLIQPHPPAVAGPKPRRPWQWRCLGSPARGPSPRSGLQGDQVGLQGWATGEAGPGGGGGGGESETPSRAGRGLLRWRRGGHAPGRLLSKGRAVMCPVRAVCAHTVPLRSQPGQSAGSWLNPRQAVASSLLLPAAPAPLLTAPAFPLRPTPQEA